MLTSVRNDTLIDAQTARDIHVGARQHGLIWVVYRHPLDYPDKYIARPFKTRFAVLPLPVHLEARTLKRLRRQLPLDLLRIDRFDDDDANIVETWC